jgi:transcription elongation factor GreA
VRFVAAFMAFNSSEEADMAAGKISYKSPLGAALMDAKTGDTVSFESPNGTTQYTIISIS